MRTTVLQRHNASSPAGVERLVLRGPFDRALVNLSHRLAEAGFDVIGMDLSQDLAPVTSQPPDRGVLLIVSDRKLRLLPGQTATEAALSSVPTIVAIVYEESDGSAVILVDSRADRTRQSDDGHFAGRSVMSRIMSRFHRVIEPLTQSRAGAAITH